MKQRRSGKVLNTFPALVEAGSQLCVPIGQEISSTESSPILGTLWQAFRSDEELAEQLQQGNADALTPLFERHSPLLFSICGRILRNSVETEDAVQQVFLEVFRSIHQFNPKKGTFKTWLLMFAYHRTLNHRRTLLAAHFFEMDQFDDQRSDLRQTGRTYQGPEGGILLEQVLSGLQPRQRRTIELTYYEGLTADEISMRTGETVRVVRHNLYRGMERLRKALCDPNFTSEVNR